MSAFSVGDKVQRAGYVGTVVRVCEWTADLYEVRFGGGVACVCGSDLEAVK